MRIFIYEFVTGGGWCFEHLPPESLLREAKSMVSALAGDFAATSGCEAVILEDVRWPLGEIRGVQRIVSEPPHGNGNLSSALRVARECDGTLVIAPEFYDILADYVDALENSGVRLLSPPGYFVYIGSDKLLTYSNIGEYVQVPRTLEITSFNGELPAGARYPMVLKPRSGCGSLGVQRLASPNDAYDWKSVIGDPDDVIVQDLIAGTAASVALLCGPKGVYPFPACTQRLSDDGRFQYLGGECPLPQPLACRAELLARRALCGLQSDCGYVGVDLILGEAEDGSQDYVIEINPRLTTSYVGLRALSNTNLAQAMLDVAQGREPQLDWKPGRVRWSADGVVEYFEP